MECFSFKSGHAMQVAKLIKEDWHSKNFNILVLPLKYTGVQSGFKLNLYVLL